MIDSYKHKGLRKKLVEEVNKKGIEDKNILSAIEKIPRHFFLDSSFESFAYEDKPFPIGSGQTISQPYTVAYQTYLLDVKPREKILEIGTGSGYQACVLIELGARVYSIERHRTLYQKAKKQLRSMGYSPNLFYGDGYKGLPAYAPFDKILITAAAPELPPELFKQLKIGGVIVIPVGGSENQTMKRIIKTDDNNFEEESFGYFRFVPLLSDKE